MLSIPLNKNGQHYARPSFASLNELIRPDKSVCQDIGARDFNTQSYTCTFAVN